MSAVLNPIVTSPVVRSTRSPNAISDSSPAISDKLDYHRFSVVDFEQMVERGILSSETPVELINGLVVSKMPRNPLHDGTLDLLEGILLQLVPVGWFVRSQRTIRNSDVTSLEPDLAIVRGDRSAYLRHHPFASETGLIVEVANSSLKFDLETKAAVYADAGIAVYWVVNLIERNVVVMSDPRPAGVDGEPNYRNHKTVAPGETIELILDDRSVASFAVNAFLV